MEKPDRYEKLRYTEQKFFSPRVQTAGVPEDFINNNYARPTKKYLEELKVNEDLPHQKMMITKDWEKQPTVDRNHYLKSPQFRYHQTNGDFRDDRYQARWMNRRFKQGDTFCKVMPTYHHTRDSSYNNNLSQTHRTYSEHKTDDIGNDLGNLDLQYHKKKDYMQHYHDLIMGLGPELAP